jgi:hypothetical protein
LVTFSSEPTKARTDRGAQGPAVRRGADVADDLTVTEHRLGVEEQRLGVGEPT